MSRDEASLRASRAVGSNSQAWITAYRSVVLFLLVGLASVVAFSSNRAIITTSHAFQPVQQRHHHRLGQTTATSTTFRALPPVSMSTSRLEATVSLKEYLEGELDKGTIEDPGLVDVILALADSCAEVSLRLQTLSLGLFHCDADETSSGNGNGKEVTTRVNVQGEQQKGMDVVANDVFKTNLCSVNSVVAMASEEEDSVILTRNRNTDGNDTDGNGFEVAFDPLDGSGNLDVDLPTGSIFGIAQCPKENGNGENEAFFSRPGSALCAAGYAVYSSSTEFVLALGTDHPDGVLGFTLDPSRRMSASASTKPGDAFVLSRTAITCPDSGPYYSLNEARAPDWPRGLVRWIEDAKRGATPTQQLYSARYVCSLCADVHRTLLKGGWAGNPRPHLRLLYEAAPLALVLQAAGGRGSDGVRDLLEIRPGEGSLHDRVPVFLGSRAEIVDLVEIYGDVQQIESKRYEA